MKADKALEEYIRKHVRDALVEQATNTPKSNQPSAPQKVPPPPSAPSSPTRSQSSSLEPSNTQDTSGEPADDTSIADDASLEGDLGSSDLGGGDLSGDPGTGEAGIGDDSLDGEEGDSSLGGSGGGGFGGGGMGFGGGGGGGGFSGGDSGDIGEEGEDSEDSGSITPSGEPEKNQEDPIGAAVREAEKLVSQTTEIQKILNGVKASIQVNFSDYKQAWPIVKALRDTNNKTLEAVASRLALFIADVLEENKNRKNKTMKITKEELRKLVREAVRQKLLSENSSYLEQEKMRQEVNMLALEFLEKLTQKLSIDPTSLSPEALESYKTTHKNLEVAVRTAAAELFRLGAVVNAANPSSGETK